MSSRILKSIANWWSDVMETPMPSQTPQEFTLNPIAPEDPASILVAFPVRYEHHDRVEFQKAGHTIPALRPLDADGRPNWNTDRPWGPIVHVLWLAHPQAPDDPKAYVLRVLSDSLEDVVAQFQDRLPHVLYGLKAAEAAKGLATGDYERIMREHSNMRQWIATKEPEALEGAMNGKH